MRLDLNNFADLIDIIKNQQIVLIVSGVTNLIKNYKEEFTELISKLHD
jgi:hypothetical protein